MSLITHPTLTLTPEGSVSLPALFAAFTRGEVRGFRRLRAHQRAPWHMFCVQLAALALDRGGVAEPPTDANEWATLLLGLTDGDEDPWRLVAPDRAKPAFLQPPDPGGLKWEAVVAPDALDLLITARNHDLKAAVARDAAPEDWVFALVSLQTGEGFGGRGNYGIARMNGGSSSRAMLGFAPAGDDGQPDPSSWWRRDVALMLRHRDVPSVLTRGGPALLWLEAWPEGRQIPAQTIDPLAIEVCRRVRLIERGGALLAERANSTAARVDAKAFRGVLDDPWAPVNVKEAKALTLGEGDFDYRRMVALLSSDEWRRPLAATIDAETEIVGEMVVIAEALSRGNSKTDGLKSRVLPLPERVRRAATDPERLSTAAQEQYVLIAAADAALREAVALYVAGGDHEKVGKPQRQRAATARHRLDDHVDRVFFRHLWARIAAAQDGFDARMKADRAFRDELVIAARRELSRAFDATSCAAAFEPRARVRATRRLESALRRNKVIEEDTVV